jgi:hypothetical protein
LRHTLKKQGVQTINKFLENINPCGHSFPARTIALFC